MKKTVKNIFAFVLVFTFIFSLTGCLVNEKKEEAIEKHAAVATSFNEVATLINNNSDKINSEVISTYQEMSNLLNQYTQILESDEDLSDEKYDEMINWFKSVEDWVKETKTEIEAMVNAG